MSPSKILDPRISKNRAQGKKTKFSFKPFPLLFCDLNISSVKVLWCCATRWRSLRISAHWAWWRCPWPVCWTRLTWLWTIASSWSAPDPTASSRWRPHLGWEQQVMVGMDQNSPTRAVMIRLNLGFFKRLDGFSVILLRLTFGFCIAIPPFKQA